MKSISSIFTVLLSAAFVILVSLLIYSTSDMRNWHAYWVLFSTTVATSMLAVLGAVYVRQRGIGRRIQVIGCLCCFLLCLAQLPTVFAKDASAMLPVIICGLVALGLLMDLRFVYTLSAGSGLVIAYLIATAIVMRSEEHTSELQSLMRISYAVFCLKKKKQHH